jgi:hypothetical protein
MPCRRRWVCNVAGAGRGPAPTSEDISCAPAGTFRRGCPAGSRKLSRASYRPLGRRVFAYAMRKSTPDDMSGGTPTRAAMSFALATQASCCSLAFRSRSACTDVAAWTDVLGFGAAVVDVFGTLPHRLCVCRRSHGARVLLRASAGCAERQTRSGLLQSTGLRSVLNFEGANWARVHGGAPVPRLSATLRFGLARSDPPASVGRRECLRDRRNLDAKRVDLVAECHELGGRRGFQGVRVGLSMEPVGHGLPRGREQQRGHERHEPTSAGDCDQRYQNFNTHAPCSSSCRCEWAGTQPGLGHCRNPVSILRQIYSPCFARWSAVCRAGHRCPARRIRVRQGSAVLAGCLGGVTVPGLQPPPSVLLNQTGRPPRLPRSSRSYHCLAQTVRSR